jgi:hypothetical protein
MPTNPRPDEPIPVPEPDVVRPPTPLEEPQPEKGPDLPQPGPDVVVPPGPEPAFARLTALLRLRLGP